MARVPYFASVLPHVVRMEPGLAEARVPKWFMVYNHLHTVHAIAWRAAIAGYPRLI
jgi:hypothetical protein